MSAPFLICCLPRSRSAWLANFLTFGNVECGHELCASFSPTTIQRILLESECSYSGNADTSQAVFVDALRSLAPECPIVVVRREPAEVAESLSKIGLPITRKQLDPLVFALDHAEALSNTLVIRYEDLSDESTMQELQQHVAPGEPFNAVRFAMLRGMNVQITPARLKKIIKSVEENYA